jgi:hypothetical protein
MAFLISMILPFVAVVLLTAGTSIAWWASLQRPWLFVLLGSLTVLGLHRVIQAAIEVIKFFPIGGGYFLEYRKNPAAMEMVQESLNRQALTEVTLVLFFGYFVLSALRAELAKV